MDNTPKTPKSTRRAVLGKKPRASVDLPYKNVGQWLLGVVLSCCVLCLTTVAALMVSVAVCRALGVGPASTVADLLVVWAPAALVWLSALNRVAAKVNGWIFKKVLGTPEATADAKED